jgi:hypothetical protein
MIGGERRWRWKDIEALMEGGVTDFYGKSVWRPEKASPLVKESK